MTSRNRVTLVAMRWNDWSQSSELRIEDWGAEKSELDTEPVPAWRRHAWHKKLLKTVRRALANQ